MAEEDPELLRIIARQNQLKERIAETPQAEECRAAVARLDALDVRDIGSEMAAQLVCCFEDWTDQDNEQEPLMAIYFEWSCENFEATGYGFGECTPRDGTMSDFDLDDALFYDSGSLLVDRIMDVTAEERSTAFLDLQIQKVAEATHHAVADAIESAEFEALAKQDELYFLVGQHDRGPTLAYLWRAPQA